MKKEVSPSTYHSIWFDADIVGIFFTDGTVKVAKNKFRNIEEPVVTKEEFERMVACDCVNFAHRSGISVLRLTEAKVKKFVEAGVISAKLR